MPLEPKLAPCGWRCLWGRLVTWNSIPFDSPSSSASVCPWRATLGISSQPYLSLTPSCRALNSKGVSLEGLMLAEALSKSASHAAYNTRGYIYNHICHVAGAARPESCAVIYLIYIVIQFRLSCRQLPAGWHIRWSEEEADV